MSTFIKMLSIKMLTGLVAVLLGSTVAAVPAPGDNSAAGSGVGMPRTASHDVGNEVFSVIASPTNYCLSMLYHVNVHRLNHSAPLISYNRTLEAQIHDYIGGCAAPSETAFPGSLGMSTAGNGVDWQSSVDLVSGALSSFWYDPYDIELYRNLTEDYTKPPSSVDGLDGNSFTRLIWKGQQSMGCWAQECGPGTGFFENQVQGTPGGDIEWTWNVMCAFYPGGNVLSPKAFAENVSGPLGLPTDNADTHINNSTDC